MWEGEAANGIMWEEEAANGIMWEGEAANGIMWEGGEQAEPCRREGACQAEPDKLTFIKLTQPMSWIQMYSMHSAHAAFQVPSPSLSIVDEFNGQILVHKLLTI